MKTIITICVILFITITTFGQNVAISDDDTYVANSSAMLDVKSIDKGILIPRLTTVQRTAISNPATGLLVFDTDAGSFFFYNGAIWTNLSGPAGINIWGYNSPNIYLNSNNDRVGIGTGNPNGKLIVKGDVSMGINDPLFSVVNVNGDTVMAVYNEGVRINVQDNPGKATGSKGGFAVGGFSPAKGSFTNEFLRVTPDSVRIWVPDTVVNKAIGSKGGFAVGGYSPAKGTSSDYLFVTDDSSRVYVDGFGGFSVGDISGGTVVDFMNLTPLNYYIGHESGQKNTNGLYNSVLGYQAGKSNTIGSWNLFSGYQTGFSNTTGYSNSFIGYKSGYSNIDGFWNIFMGPESGFKNADGNSNIYIGYQAGHENISGFGNICIGASAGYKSTASGNIYIGEASGLNTTSGYGNICMGMNSGSQIGMGTFNMFLGNNSGQKNTGANNLFVGPMSGINNVSGTDNVLLGCRAGENSIGSRNVFIGFSAGQNQTGNDKLIIDNTNTFQPLIFGDFSERQVSINYGDPISGRTFFVNGVAGGTSGWNTWSDARLKENVKTIENALDKVMKLRGVTFSWKENNDMSLKKGTDLGFIAQEALKIIPELVTKAVDDKDYYSIEYAQVVALLVEAMKEQQKIIDEQQKNLEIINTEKALLQTKTDRLETEIEKIKAYLENSAKK